MEKICRVVPSNLCLNLSELTGEMKSHEAEQFLELGEGWKSLAFPPAEGK